MAESKVTPPKKVSKPKNVATEKTSAKEKAVVKKVAAAKKTTASKTAVKKTKTSTANLEHRYKLIEIAAYFIAEKDGFASNPVDYWLAAEAEINQSGT